MNKTPSKIEAEKKLSVINMNSSMCYEAILENLYPFLSQGVLWITCEARWVFSRPPLQPGAEQIANLPSQNCRTGRIELSHYPKQTPL